MAVEMAGDALHVEISLPSAPPAKSQWKDGAAALRETSAELRDLGMLKYGFQPFELAQLMSLPKARALLYCAHSPTSRCVGATF